MRYLRFFGKEFNRIGHGVIGRYRFQLSGVAGGTVVKDHGHTSVSRGPDEMPDGLSHLPDRRNLTGQPPTETGTVLLVEHILHGLDLQGRRGVRYAHDDCKT